MSTHIFEHQFLPGEPYFKGHFPGNPVVPGVVIIDTVLGYLTGEDAGAQVEAIPKIKFTEPVLPGQLLRIEIIRSYPKVSFKVYRDNSLVAEGELRIREENPDE